MSEIKRKPFLAGSVTPGLGQRIKRAGSITEKIEEFMTKLGRETDPHDLAEQAGVYERLDVTKDDVRKSLGVTVKTTEISKIKT
jgi:hypothetical protein